MGMLPNGVKMVQEHLGHKSGNSSMMYLSVKRSEVDAAAHRSLVGALWVEKATTGKWHVATMSRVLNRIGAGA